MARELVDIVSVLEADDWINQGLRLLRGVPEGLEGGIRQQQAALAFQQALRCGGNVETLQKKLMQNLLFQIRQLRSDLRPA